MDARRRNTAAKAHSARSEPPARTAWTRICIGMPPPEGPRGNMPKTRLEATRIHSTSQDVTAAPAQIEPAGLQKSRVRERAPMRSDRQGRLVPSPRSRLRCSGPGPSRSGPRRDRRDPASRRLRHLRRGRTRDPAQFRLDVSTVSKRMAQRSPDGNARYGFGNRARRPKVAVDDCAAPRAGRCRRNAGFERPAGRSNGGRVCAMSWRRPGDGARKEPPAKASCKSLLREPPKRYFAEPAAAPGNAFSQAWPKTGFAEDARPLSAALARPPARNHPTRCAPGAREPAA